MSSLFQISTEIRALADYAGSTDPEEQQAFLDTLEGLTGELQAKADDYAYVKDAIDNQVEVVTKEIDRLTKIKKALTKSKASLMDRFLVAMQTLGEKTITTALHTFKRKKNPPKLVLDFDEKEVDKFPDNYLTTVLTVKVDKDKIKKDLKDGVELSFARFEQGERVDID